jgi:hypothetical protein
MKKTLNVTAILLLINVMVNAQTPCEQKLKNAKNSIIAIVNSGGSNSKINQTATDVMTNMALNCPESVKEFNKFIQELGKNAKSEEGLDGNVQGNYQTNQERQKGYDEFNRQTNRSYGGQGANNTNTNNQNSNNANPNRTGNSQTGMKGDGYAELPFKEGGDDTNNNNSRNTGSQNTGGRGISGNAIENQRQNEQYKNQAHSQIQNGNGGFKPVENEGDLIAPKLNLDNEIRNFENKLTQVPENLKPDLLAKANFILKTETNSQEAASKLVSLMKEFERNNRNEIQAKTQKIKEQSTIQSDRNKMNNTVEQTKNNANIEWEQQQKLEDEMRENKDVWQKKIKVECYTCIVTMTRDYSSLVIYTQNDKQIKEKIYRILNQSGKKILKENAEGSIYFIP